MATLYRYLSCQQIKMTEIFLKNGKVTLIRMRVILRYRCGLYSGDDITYNICQKKARCSCSLYPRKCRNINNVYPVVWCIFYLSTQLDYYHLLIYLFISRNCSYITKVSVKDLLKKLPPLSV